MLADMPDPYLFPIQFQQDFFLFPYVLLGTIMSWSSQHGIIFSLVEINLL